MQSLICSFCSVLSLFLTDKTEPQHKYQKNLTVPSYISSSFLVHEMDLIEMSGNLQDEMPCVRCHSGPVAVVWSSFLTPPCFVSGSRILQKECLALSLCFENHLPLRHCY